jgi:hypothetical protein
MTLRLLTLNASKCQTDAFPVRSPKGINGIQRDLEILTNRTSLKVCASSSV